MFKVEFINIELRNLNELMIVNGEDKTQYELSCCMNVKKEKEFPGITIQDDIITTDEDAHNVDHLRLLIEGSKRHFREVCQVLNFDMQSYERLCEQWVIEECLESIINNNEWETTNYD